MPETDSQPDDGHESDELLYFHRGRMLARIAGLALTLGAILLFAWLASDASWRPKLPPHLMSGHYRKGALYIVMGWAFLTLFLQLPVLFRLVVLAWMGQGLARLLLRTASNAFDTIPDFTIGPAGVGGWHRKKFRIIAWSHLEGVSVFGPDIRFVGPREGPRLFHGTLPPIQLELVYSQLLFGKPVEEILTTVRHFRPDLKICLLERKASASTSQSPPASTAQSRDPGRPETPSDPSGKTVSDRR